jgi:DNA excision repair protein ERCC-2
MPPRFDDQSSTLELSVADLLEQDVSGSIGFGNRGGYERLWLGQAIHSRYQEEAQASDGSYRREVVISAELVHRGWQVLLRGRIDGLRREPDGALVVEEIKSVRRGGQLSAHARERFARQALLYAWILRQQQDEPVRAELVLIEIGTDEVERETLEVSWSALGGEVRRRLSALIRAHHEERGGSEERRSIAAGLSFPFPELRSGQREILEAVDACLENRDHLLLQAPTGIGKTVAALFPALRYALANDKRVFVLTSKTLQQDMAMKVVGLLNQGGFHALRLRAKAKMCANGEVICHEEYCPFAREYHGKLQTSSLVPRLLAHHPLLEPDTVYETAKAAEVCPFEVSLDLAGRVQLVACDYNYAFDPYVALSDFSEDQDLGDTILIIDEVHNLLERGRGYYSPSLSAAAARRAAEDLFRGSDPVLLELAEIAEKLATLIEEAAAEAIPEADHEPRSALAALPEEELWLLRPLFDGAFVDYLEHRREHKSFRADDPFVALYFDFLKLLNVLLQADDPAFSTLVTRSREEARLQILCKDPSRFLGRVLGRVHSAIGLSATLTPPELYRDLLGFEAHRTTSLTIPNPFPAENRCIVIDAGVETTWRQRPTHYPRIARRLSAFAAAIPGNCLALFPSYDFLAQVAGLLEVPGKRLLIQQRSDSDRARSDILDTLRGALLGDVVLLAVAGGVFAEGVDYPGEMLQGVAVVGPCLPAVCLERELLKEYYQERFERGFEYAYVVPGMTRVVQAAGRLLRSPNDRGVISLLDRRFLARPYASYLPAEWLPDEGVRGLVGDPARIATGFFSGAGPGVAPDSSRGQKKSPAGGGGREEG